MGLLGTIENDGGEKVVIKLTTRQAIELADLLRDHLPCGEEDAFELLRAATEVLSKQFTAARGMVQQTKKENAENNKRMALVTEIVRDLELKLADKENEAARYTLTKEALRSVQNLLLSPGVV